MFDFSPLDNWMNPESIRSDADTLKSSGSNFANGVKTAGERWSPIGEAYRKGPGREDLINAMVPPQLHGRGVEIMTGLCKDKLHTLADGIEILEKARQRAIDHADDMKKLVEEAKANGDYDELKEDYDWRIEMTQRDIDAVGNEYDFRVKEATDGIRSISTTSEEVQKAMMDSDVIDWITGPMGSELTPAISAILKLINKSKDGDKIPPWTKQIEKLRGSTFGKWLTKFTTPISWGLNYLDQADDSYALNIMLHPEWSTEQIENRVVTEIKVKGTTRSLVGTTISEIASAKASARAGAIAGSRGGPPGVALGALVGFVYGSAANAVARHLNIGSGASNTVQSVYDHFNGGSGPKGAEEWAPDTYHIPEDPRPPFKPGPPAGPPTTTGPGLPTAPAQPPYKPGYPTETPPSTGPGLPQAPAPLPNPYVVKEGDYLDKIAKEYGTEWPKVYEANKDKIKNPDIIYPGQKITIPQR